MPIDIQVGLHYYGLGLIKREYDLYCLVDLETGEWFEKMTIYYIQKLLNTWLQHRDVQEI
ncbi:MAG: hypothetical protein RR630_09260 [Coprobacillus sp.]